MRRATVVLLSLLAITFSLQAEDVPPAARTLVTKAIQAHGGEPALRRLLTATWTGRGLAYKKDDEEHAMAFFADWMAALPGKYRYVYKFRGLGSNLPVTTAF